MFDLRLKCPFTMVITGPTQAGKSSKCANLLKMRNEMMDKSPDLIIWYYKLWQPSFDTFDKMGIVNEWINKLPTLEELEEKTSPYKDKNGSLVVIDDFMLHLTPDIAELYTTLSHANSVSCCILTQNLFNRDPVFRNISLQTRYLLVCRNPRDMSQIVHLGKQLAPGNVKFFAEVFRHATRMAYGYLFMDFHQECPEALKFRTRIFPHEWPMVVYTPRTCIT